MFKLTSEKIDGADLRKQLENSRAGAVVTFEGVVRDHNEGHSVKCLEYEAYPELAELEGRRIVTVALEKYGVLRCEAVHRFGSLAVGETAVWIGVLSEHRKEGFAACQFVIDEIKHRLPVWKKEHYIDGNSGWVNCQHVQGSAPESSLQHEHGDAHSDCLLDVLDLSGADLRRYDIIDISAEPASQRYDHLWGILRCELKRLPFQKLDLNCLDLDSKKNYLFVCDDGLISNHVVKQLRERGYKNVFGLLEGSSSLRRKIMA